MNLGPGKEFDRIRAILAAIAPFDQHGDEIGDDCAIVPVADTFLAISMDCALEGVHFRTDWLDFKEIGFRSAGAALSDLAADGATPFGLMVTLGLPSDHDGGVDPAAEIMTGVATMAHNLQVRILGGDLVRADRYMVDVCVLGTAVRPVRRSGAQQGDALWVTGYLGGAALALDGMRAGRKMPQVLRNRYACPEPRIEAGRWLASHGATAMIDISDGLAADAQHLAAASEVALEIQLDKIPTWDGVDPLTALGSGEEFELLVTMPPTFSDAIASSFRGQTGLELTRIGTCLRGSGGRRENLRLMQGSKTIPLPPGYDHFA